MRQTTQNPLIEEKLQSAIKLHQEGQLARARTLYEQILMRQPQHFDALHLLGVIAAQHRDPRRAVQLIARALEAEPANAAAYAAHINKGLGHRELNQLHAALDSFEHAIAIRPDVADGYFNRGEALQELKRYEAAIASYDIAVSLNSACRGLMGTRRHVRMQICDWSGWEADIVEIGARIERQQPACDPFVVLTLADSPALQKRSAQIWAREACRGINTFKAFAKRAKRDKIRIGYFSADFHDHATMHLMASLLEMHDREKFHLAAFSFGPESRSAMRMRVLAACDEFIDVRDKSDQEVAMLARDRQIDLAVDLKGFTMNNRAGIFACRAAPIQINYLGYPGTMGAEYIDYLIADRTLIPEGSERHYSERIVFLPDSYQVNDQGRAISERGHTREEHGLPPTGFVFCCFNSNYKITPDTFDGWMRILKRVEGSVLWLLEENVEAAANLRREALRRGVPAERLVFAKRIEAPEHLARHGVADLFLDTLPCNAHTTASDALWAGLPVLTCIGEAFAGRVAASLLNAVRLPELITTTQEQYEQLAVTLAGNSQLLAQIKERLRQNRRTTPLFDTGLFTKHLESAYAKMFEGYQAGLPAEHIGAGT